MAKQIVNEIEEVMNAGKEVKAEKTVSRSRDELKAWLTANQEVVNELRVMSKNSEKFRYLADNHNFTVKEISIVLGVETTAIRQSLSKRPTGVRTSAGVAQVSEEDKIAALDLETVKARIIFLLEKKTYNNAAIAQALTLKPQRVSMVKSELNIKSNALI